MWAEQFKFSDTKRKRVECIPFTAHLMPSAFVECSLSHSVCCHNFFFFFFPSFQWNNPLIFNFVTFQTTDYIQSHAHKRSVYCDWFHVIWLPFKINDQKRKKLALNEFKPMSSSLLLVEYVFVARQTDKLCERFRRICSFNAVSCNRNFERKKSVTSHFLHTWTFSHFGFSIATERRKSKEPIITMAFSVNISNQGLTD